MSSNNRVIIRRKVGNGVYRTTSLSGTDASMFNFLSLMLNIFKLIFYLGFGIFILMYKGIKLSVKHFKNKNK